MSFFSVIFVDVYKNPLFEYSLYSLNVLVKLGFCFAQCSGLLTVCQFGDSFG